MSAAYKCERCHSLREGQPAGSVTLVRTAAHVGNSVKLELCDSCFGDLADVAKRIAKVVR